MKTLKYRIFETPDLKVYLSAVSSDGDQQILRTGTEAECIAIIDGIASGERDAMGCRTILEREVDILENTDIH